MLSMPRQNAVSRNPKTYLAGRQTLPARFRAALTGLGSIVARFGVSLRKLNVARSRSAKDPTALSVTMGTALRVSGVLVAILAYLQSTRRIHDLQAGIQSAGSASALALFLALSLSASGIATGVYVGAKQAATRFPTYGRKEDQGNRIR